MQRPRRPVRAPGAARSPDGRWRRRAERGADRVDGEVGRYARYASTIAEIAHDLTAAFEPGEQLFRIARSARLAGRADSAYVERADFERDEVEVVAGVGIGYPPLGTRVPYPGSLAEEAIERGAPEIIPLLTEKPRPSRAILAEACGVCDGMVAPLISEGEALGALVLLRTRGSPPFTGEDLELIHTLSDLAALSLERALVLDGSERHRQRAEEAEQAYRSLYRYNLNAVFMLDAEGRFESVNPAAVRLGGYPPDEIIGMPFDPLVDEEDRERTRAAFGRVLEGEAQSIALRVIRRDGRQRDVEVTGVPTVVDGRVEGMFAVARDVTKERRSERERERLLARERTARAEAEERADVERSLRHAAEAISNMFTVDEIVRAITKTVRRATRADGAFVERLGPHGESVEVVGIDGAETPMIHARGPLAGSLAEAVLERAEPIHIARLADTDRRLPDDLAGRCGDCHAVAIPLTNAGGAEGVLVLVRRADIAPFGRREVERAQTFATLARVGFRKIHLLRDAERRRQEIQRVMRSRARLMRGFGHDVKNPLGAADGYLGLLATGTWGPLDPDQRKGVDHARESLRTALELIEHLLEFSRAEAGAIQIEARPVDLREAAREVVEEYRAQAEAKGLTIGAEVPDQFPIVETDRSRVHQILGNIVANAVKYTEEGGVTVRVATYSGPAAPGPGRWARACVADTGPGIPKEKQDLLFQEFARLEPGAAHGAGLGLAISRRLARALGGDIAVESEVGKGSTFTLWIPLEDPRRRSRGREGAPR